MNRGKKEGRKAIEAICERVDHCRNGFHERKEVTPYYIRKGKG